MSSVRTLKRCVGIVRLLQCVNIVLISSKVTVELLVIVPSRGLKDLVLYNIHHVLCTMLCYYRVVCDCVNFVS